MIHIETLSNILVLSEAHMIHLTNRLEGQTPLLGSAEVGQLAPPSSQWPLDTPRPRWTFRFHDDHHQQIKNNYERKCHSVDDGGRNDAGQHKLRMSNCLVYHIQQVSPGKKPRLNSCFRLLDACWPWNVDLTVFSRSASFLISVLRLSFPCFSALAFALKSVDHSLHF